LLYFKLRAYIKVQTKVVTEAAAKDLIGCFLVDVQSAVDFVLAEALAEERAYADSVREPGEHAKLREKLERQVADLKRVAEELKQI